MERLNRTLLAMLVTCAKDNPLDWEKHVRKVVMACNASVQTSTGYTPFFLMFGCQAHAHTSGCTLWCFQIMLHSLPVCMHLATLRKQMNKAFALARKHSLLRH